MIEQYRTFLINGKMPEKATCEASETDAIQVEVGVQGENKKDGYERVTLIELKILDKDNKLVKNWVTYPLCLMKVGNIYTFMSPEVTLAKSGSPYSVGFARMSDYFIEGYPICKESWQL